MTCYLFNSGWFNWGIPFSSSSVGVWTTLADFVSATDLSGIAILVQGGVIANTLGGSDFIYGSGKTVGIQIDSNGTLTQANGTLTLSGTSSGSNSYGILNNGTLTQANGTLTLSGTSSGSNSYGILNNGTISTASTGNFSDNIKVSITGTGFGLYNNNTGLINTFGGNDSVSGQASSLFAGTGIFNRGTINTGGGTDPLSDNDLISGTGNYVVGAPSGYGYGIKNEGIIKTGIGNDTIVGTPVSNKYVLNGISNSGLIDTGDDNDSITGSVVGNSPLPLSTSGTIGILNNGSIDTGSGSDSITGDATAGSNSIGISNLSGGFINSGLGADSINGTGNGTGSIGISNAGGGFINSGLGADYITGTGNGTSSIGISNKGTISKLGSSSSTDAGIISGTSNGGGSSSRGIYNSGVITTGDATDSITGIAVGGGYGIYNDGSISTGGGNDKLFSSGDFGGTGNVFLGAGDDKVTGFGSGNFNGEDGSDTLVLPILQVGSYYTLTKISASSAKITRGSSSSPVMNITNFENLVAGFTNLPSGFNLSNYLSNPFSVPLQITAI